MNSKMVIPSFKIGVQMRRAVRVNREDSRTLKMIALALKVEFIVEPKTASIFCVHIVQSNCNTGLCGLCSYLFVVAIFHSHRM